MFVNTFFRRVLFNTLSLFVFFFIYYLLFYELYISDTVIISFAVHPFNICEKYPEMWFYIKLIYIPVSLISSLIFINLIYSSVFTKKEIKEKAIPVKTSDLYLNIFNETNKNLIIPESGLYQNFLITGTIGSGKTSSVMYPLTRQLIEYKSNDIFKKLGMLILDVKGNYYSKVKKYASYYNRNDDLIVIEIRSEILSIIPLISQI